MSSTSPAPPPKNSQNLRNPLWRDLASKLQYRLSSVTPFYKWEAISFHHILSDLVSDFGKGPKIGFKKYIFSELAKSLQPTLESSSIQTTEQIVKCHTIIEMGSHDLSPRAWTMLPFFLHGLNIPSPTAQTVLCAPSKSQPVCLGLGIYEPSESKASGLGSLIKNYSCPWPGLGSHTQYVLQKWRNKGEKKHKSKKYWSKRKYSNISWTCIFCWSRMDRQEWTDGCCRVTALAP